jgi:hypothetical protein
VIGEILGRFDYGEFSDNVERIYLSTLSDGALVDALRSGTPGAVLFTGGGILGEELLRLPGLRFIHVHPGYLPHVRGADGLFWSILVRGKIGLSAFYMSRQIDEGGIIVADEYEQPAFDITGIQRPDDTTLYRAVFSFYDPVLRAEYFARRVLESGQNLYSLPTSVQKRNDGLTYHFMNFRLLTRTLARMFRSGT